MYKIIALMGEAGSGKDSCLKALLASNPAYHKIISCTTRPPREGEIDGVDYHFFTEEEFNIKLGNNEMAEWTSFNSWLYGTLISCLSDENINVGVFNPEGIRQLIDDKKVEAKVYYLRTSAKERLLRQLNREENPCIGEIIRRFSADKDDFTYISDIPFIPLDNETPDDLIKAVEIISMDNSD
jgi:guanylate kinase